MRRLGKGGEGKEIELTRFDSSETMASSRRFNPGDRREEKRRLRAAREEKIEYVGDEPLLGS